MNQYSETVSSSNREKHLPWYRKATWLLSAAASLLVVALLARSTSWAQIASYLPFLIILACPVAMLLMCRNHGKPDSGSRSTPDRTDRL